MKMTLLPSYVFSPNTSWKQLVAPSEEWQEDYIKPSVTTGIGIAGFGIGTLIIAALAAYYLLKR